MTVERPDLSIDGLMAELMALAQISEAEPPVVTRVVFGEADMRARAYVKGLCEEAGLRVSQDAVGNTFARWEGSDPTLAPVGTGSHIDAIPNAGLYDGCVGVLGGLEAIRVLKKLGFKPRRSIELVIFTAEEPTRFGIGCLGSRMMANVLTPTQALALRDKEDRGLEEWRAQAGFTGSLESVAVPNGRFHQFVELHIEQGPYLEAGRTRRGPGDAHCRAGQPAHCDRRRRRPCRRQTDAGPQGCARRGGGVDSGSGIGGEIDGRHRYCGHRGHLRSLSRRREQRSFPRAAHHRRARHRWRAPRPRFGCTRRSMPTK